jgi:hypothetical protein
MRRTPARGATLYRQRPGRDDRLLQALSSLAVLVVPQHVGDVTDGWARVCATAAAVAAVLVLGWLVAGTRWRPLRVALDGETVWGRVLTRWTLSGRWSAPVRPDEVAEVLVCAHRCAPSLSKGFVSLRGAELGQYSVLLVPSASTDGPREFRRRVLSAAQAGPEQVSRAVCVPVWDPARGVLAGAPQVLSAVAPGLLASTAEISPRVRAVLERAASAGGDPGRFTKVVDALHRVPLGGQG